MEIIIREFEPDFERVSFARLQMNILSFRPKEAKENLDKLIGGETIILDAPNELIAKQFVLEALNIGVICDLLKDS